MDRRVAMPSGNCGMCAPLWPWRALRAAVGPGRVSTPCAPTHSRAGARGAGAVLPPRHCQGHPARRGLYRNDLLSAAKHLQQRLAGVWLKRLYLNHFTFFSSASQECKSVRRRQQAPGCPALAVRAMSTVAHRFGLANACGRAKSFMALHPPYTDVKFNSRAQPVR